MNEERNLDEYEFPVHTPKINYEQIQRTFRSSKIIKESQITCNHQDYIISIRMMALGEVQVFLYEKQEMLQRYIIQIDGGMICQNGCQIFNINNQIHLLLILQDGQIILRNLAHDQSQNMIDLKMDLIMISKSSQVKDNIHFAALKEGNELLDISINTNELQAKPLKLQSSWLDYFRQNKGFDFFQEIWQGLHILVCNDQLQIVQINYNTIDQYRHRVNLTDVQRKIQEIEYIPFSPFINYKKRQIYASIIIKTYSTLDLYELTLSCDNIIQGIQAQELKKAEIKGSHLDLRRSYQLFENSLYASQYIIEVRYINIFGQQNFVKQVFNEIVEEENQLISVIGDEISKVLYLSNISILCESFHTLQAQYCNINQKAFYQLKRAKEEQYSTDYVVLFQQFRCQFPDYGLENFLVAMKLIFGKPFIIAESLSKYQSPQLLQLLDDVIQDNIDVLIYMQKQLKEFDNKGIISKQLYEKLQQLNNFILSSEPPQIAIKSRRNTRNDQILRLIQIASRNLLQDIHNYYFYCLLGLYILQDQHLEDYSDYQQAYFLLLSACKIQQMKPIRNHLIQILSEYDLSQENTYQYPDINQGVNISIGYVLNYRSPDIIDILVNADHFHQNAYQVVKIYPLMDQKIKLELLITALVRQGDIFESQQELLILIIRYEFLYREEETRQFMKSLISKYCNQDLINAVLIKFDKGDQLVISLLRHAQKFKSYQSLYKVLQQVDFKNDDKVTIELLTPVFWNEQVLKGLNKIKLDYSLMIQIKRLMQLDLQQANLSSKEAVQERFILIKNQAQFLKSQGFHKQSAQLLMTFYEFLDQQEKQWYVLQYQIDVLDITLNTLYLLNHQDKCVLIYKDTSNIEFFKRKLKKKEQKLNNKLIISHQQQLKDTWNKINKQQNDMMKPRNQDDQIEIEFIKNKLTLEEYIQLERANKLPDEFRFQHEFYKNDKLKRASFLQKQLEYNRSKNHLDQKSKQQIKDLKNINRIQEDQQQKTSKKVQNYKVYQFQQLNDLLLIKQIQYFLSIKGFQYTEDFHTMALQIIEIVQHLENNYQVSSQQQLINSIMFYVPLMTFVSSYKINSYFTICLGICKTFKILEQLLNQVVKDNLTCELASIIVRFLSQNQLDKLLVYYFAQTYTEYAIQELVYLEDYSVTEKLSIILLNKYTKAKLQGKPFTLKPETVESITQIEGSPQLSEALKLINKITQIKQEKNSLFKQLQLAGITYEQYQYIRQKSNQTPQQIEQIRQMLLQKLAETKENKKQYELNNKQQQVQGNVQNLELFFTDLNYKPQPRPKRRIRNFKDYGNLGAQQFQKKQDAPSQDSYSFNEQQQFKLTTKKQNNKQQNQKIPDDQDNQGNYFQPQQDFIISPKYTNAFNEKGQQNPLKAGLSSDMIVEDDNQDIQPKFTIKVSDASKLNIAIEDPYNLGPFVKRDQLFKKSKGLQDSKKKADRQEQSQISISQIKEISDFQQIPQDKLNLEVEIREKNNQIYYQDRKIKKRQIDVLEQVRQDQEEQELYNKYFQPKQPEPEKRLLLQDAFSQPQNVLGQQSIMQQSLISYQQLNQSAPIQQNVQATSQNLLFSQQNQFSLQPALTTSVHVQQNALQNLNLMFPGLNKPNQEQPNVQQNPQQNNMLLRENFVISTESQILQPPQQEQQQNQSFQQDQPMLFSNDSRLQQSQQKPAQSILYQSNYNIILGLKKERKSVPLVYEEKPEGQK
ncbi:hypothetical protein pb186bvf_001849 [Paramecium bursaria]